MKIINFEKAKVKKQLKEKDRRHLPEISNGVMELQKQYQKIAQFYDRWYDEHVVGQDENGMWIYKNSSNSAWHKSCIRRKSVYQILWGI